jgi:hypothetical protein
MNSSNWFFGLLPVGAVLAVLLVLLLIHLFARNCDSIYDPRSRYQIWRDRRRDNPVSISYYGRTVVDARKLLKRNSKKRQK